MLHYTEIAENYGEVSQYSGNLYPMERFEMKRILDAHCIEYTEVENGLVCELGTMIPIHPQNFFAWLGY